MPGSGPRTQGGSIRFAVFTSWRTGSTWVLDMLNSAPGVEGHQELFLPQERRRPVEQAAGCNEYPRFIETRRTGSAGFRPFSVFSYLDGLYARPGTVGFKLVYSHLRTYPEILPYLIWRRVRILHLIRRNHLDVVLSTTLARVTGRAHFDPTFKPSAPVPVCLDLGTLLSEIEHLERNVHGARALLRWLPCPRLEVAYEDLRDVETFTRVCEFLDTHTQGSKLRSSIPKRQTRSHSEAIQNYSDVKAVLAGSRWASLLE